MCLKRLRTAVFERSKPLHLLRLNWHVGAIPTDRVYWLSDVENSSIEITRRACSTCQSHIVLQSVFIIRSIDMVLGRSIAIVKNDTGQVNKKIAYKWTETRDILYSTMYQQRYVVHSMSGSQILSLFFLCNLLQISYIYHPNIREGIESSLWSVDLHQLEKLLTHYIIYQLMISWKTGRRWCLQSQGGISVTERVGSIDICLLSLLHEEIIN